MFTSQQNFSIVQTELDTVFFQSLAYDATSPGIATANTPGIFKIINIDRAAYIGSVNKGVGLFSEIGETTTVPLMTPKVTNKYTQLVKDYAGSIEISKDLFDDNMHGVWENDVRDFALKARVTQDDNAFKVIRGAFDTTLTADGQYAVYNAHTLIGGGTQSNVVAGALSTTTLDTGIKLMREMKDQSGVILGCVPSILLVPPALFTTAIKITESALLQGTGNNDINVYRSAYGIQVYQSPYLGTAAGGLDTDWFLLAPNHSITRVIRQGIETALRPWQMSNNRTYLYQANFREVVFIADYSGFVGGGTTRS